MVEDEDAEILREFLDESAELLDELDSQFVALEEDPSSTQRLGAIFRVAHTIKGTSGLLGFATLERVTHAAENVLAKLRDGELVLTPAITSVLLKSVDATRTILQNIESSGAEGDEAFDEVVTDLAGVLSAPCAPAPGERGAAPTAEEAGEVSAPEPANASATERGADPEPARVSPPASALLSGIEEPRIEEAPPEHPPARPAYPAAAEAAAPHAASIPPEKARGNEGQSAKNDEGGGVQREANVRVGVGLLDRLMNLVGELVLARNQVLQASVASSDPALAAASQRLSLITTELQEGIMKTRMQPIGSVWSKFPRIVRDLAVACGKQVRLDLLGRDTELDRTVLEAIRDPLTHIVRNSVDHGIEGPADRRAKNKPEVGTIAFRAFHEGGMVNIEVTDDGRGIDPEKLRDKAIERGLVTPERAARLSDREAMLLLFLPGFSTAKEVTNISGRGVGMDVVKTGVEKIGGTIDIQSRIGEGTSIKVKIPLTLAIIPALIVCSEEHRYAIPQVNLVELVRVEERNAIEYVRDAPVYRLRGELLPIVFLGAVFGGAAKPPSAPGYNIIVLKADNRSFGLVVDDVADTQEIVVKPLGRELKSISAFAGATIMGDGRVALILDVFGLADAIGMVVRTNREDLATDSGATDAEDVETMLAFQLSEGQRMAIPLDSVDRLEEFRVDRIERAGSTEVIQYRDQILRLLHVADIVGSGRTEPSSDVVQVVVHSRDGQTIGLVVDRIADIVQDRIAVDEHVSRRGVVGSAVLHGAVTEILDVDAAWDMLQAGGF